MNFGNILFLDIETVPQFSNYNELADEWKALWNIKAGYLIRNKETETPESIYSRAGIYAEFGKIICISCGFITENGNEKKITLKSFYGDNEKIVLAEFSNSNVKIYPNPASLFFTLEGLKQGAKTNLTILNANGVIIAKANTNNANYIFNIRSLPAGTYFIKIKNEDVEVVKQFIKR